MTTVPTLLDKLKAMCTEAGLGFRYRKAGSLKPLKTLCNGQCFGHIIDATSIVITGLDAIHNEVWFPIADEVFRVSTGGWTHCA